MYADGSPMNQHDWMKERIREYESLKDAEWDLDTLLRVHIGLNDRSSEIPYAAMDTLLELARRYPDEHGFSPVSMVAYFIFMFPVQTGYRLRIFREMCEIGSDAADSEVLGLMDNSIRNEDFREFLEILIELRKTDVLRDLMTKSYSRNKTRILDEFRDRLPDPE